MNQKQVIISFFTAVITLMISAQGVYAQLGLNVAMSLPVEGNDVQDGSIVTLEQGTYQLSTKAYDKGLVGVIDKTPAIEFTAEIEDSKNYPVTSGGQATVRVSTKNGAIAVGDWVTSSEVEGVGMKAIQDGIVLGQALEPFNSASPDEIGQIKVALKIYNPYIGSNEILNAELQTDEARFTKIKDSITDIFKFTAGAAYEQPSLIWRYTLAALVILIAIVFGYLGFARVAQRGVEAIGRNPLAKQSIIIGIVLNVGVAVFIMFAGVVVAYYIIRL